MAARGGGANEKKMERDDGIGGLRDLSSVLQGRSHVFERLRVAGPQPNPAVASPLTQLAAQACPTRFTHTWGKVCFGMRCLDDIADDCGIYIVDLNDDDSDKWSFKAPTFRFSLESFNFGCFCLLGDTLYMVEMHCLYDDNSGRRVWKYKLPLSSEIVDQRLDRRDLVEITSMTYSKSFPLATSTPDGKLLVLTTEVWYGSTREANEFNFELYDPQENSWEQLPGLSSGNWMADRAVIRGLAFQNNEPVVVILTGFGMFSLDIRSSEDNKEWKPFVPSSGSFRQPVPRFTERSFILMGDDYFLNSSGAFELVGEEPKFFKYPQFEYNGRAVRSALLNMTNKNRGCLFCVMNMHIKEDIPYIFIHVYRFDYIKFKKDLEKGDIDGRLLPYTKVLKSFKFNLRPYISDIFLRPIWFGYILPGNTSTTC